MITKQEFVEIIDKLREVNDFVDETNKKARELKDIKKARELKDILSWWLYELDYGRKYTVGCIQNANGLDIDLSTADKLYNYLVKKVSE